MFSVDLSTRECDGHVVVALGGGDLLLAAPRQPVLRVLAVTRLVEDFSVHAGVEEAAGSAGRSRRAAAPAASRSARVA